VIALAGQAYTEALGVGLGVAAAVAAAAAVVVSRRLPARHASVAPAIRVTVPGTTPQGG
jgi:drug/metabolite transporter (DMT)-like permease